MTKSEQDAAASKQEAANAQEAVAHLQRHAQAVQAGMSSGAGDDEEEGNIADKMKAAQKAVQERGSEARSHELRAGVLRDRAAVLKKQTKKNAREHAALTKKLAKSESQLQKIEVWPCVVLLSDCGVVWCGVVWCGVVWCGVVWLLAWCGFLRGAVVLHD